MTAWLWIMLFQLVFVFFYISCISLLLLEWQCLLILYVRRTDSICQLTGYVCICLISTLLTLPHSRELSIQHNWAIPSTLGFITYTLQQLFKEGLGWLQKQKIVVPLGVDKISNWCNSFVLVPKPNGHMRQCLSLARLNQALNRPVHRGLTYITILILIELSSEYHN